MPCLLCRGVNLCARVVAWLHVAIFCSLLHGCPAADLCVCWRHAQTLVLPEFEDWPGDAITVEFWMLSADRCRKGVPFSYATGAYEQGDNSFLILNYNDWCARVRAAPPLLD